MEVKILGTGTSQGVPIINCDCHVCQSIDPKDKRLRSSIVVMKNDTIVLVDAGPDFRMQMLHAKVPHIDAILLTHEHNDHVAGLDDLRPFIFAQRNKRISIWALPRVLKELKNRFAYAFSDSAYPGAPVFETHEIQAGNQWSIGDIQIEAIEVLHGNLPILGYRFEDFVYITDAKYMTDAEIEKCKGAKVLILNALRKKEHWSHLTLQESLELIKKIDPETAYLTHLSHLMGTYEELTQELPPNVYSAYDGLILKIN